MRNEINEIREELRLIRQAVARTQDMVSDLLAMQTTVELTPRGREALAAASAEPAVPHIHEVRTEQPEQPKAESADPGVGFDPAELDAGPQEPEQPKAEEKAPEDLPGMRAALAAIVGGPTFTPKQKESLKAIFLRYGCTLLKEVPKESYGDVLASFRKAVEEVA